MPTINRLQPRRKEEPQKAEYTEEKLLRRKAYNNTAWRKLRDEHIRNFPLCDNCLANGKVVPAEDVHHKVSPFRNGEINWTLLLDPDNLQSLCRKCHGEEHAAEKGWKDPKLVIEALEELFKEVGDEDKGDSGQTL
jgi:5-methylcytosine-specific restriction protein A